ncbi:MG2 domain-containing protein [Chryseolinea sp. H1M3-3]|uniref:alpha-2-macroglobulin family protein n=1 Tax=Chryseolinea sp. H1M3-3 TaxID=3034144 RepID=UPI0023EC891C|nr:MG2 domain-containing protein [Chryseolinea sp. H1M3-3]
MQTFPWKKIAIGVIAIGIVVFGIFYITDSRGKKHTETYINPAFSEFITSYTAGVVSSGSAIRIILANDAVDSTFIGQESSVSLFSFEPSLKGKTVWVDKRTVEFVPESRMTSGQIYEVGFQLSKLISVAKELSEFKFSFQIMPQNFDVAVENIKPYVKTELTRQRIEGVLNTADFAEDATIESMLAAEQEGKNLKVTWSHTAEGKQHMFIVEDVVRKEAASKVVLSVDGKNLGISLQDKKEVEIPALGDFKIVNAKVVQNPNQYVVLQFSDPLKEKQELRGLISIEEDRGLILEYEIHDNEIWVYPPVRQSGTKTVYVEAGVRNINDYRMKVASSSAVVFEQLKPLARFVGKGTILPSTDGLILPFEAVNLKAIDLTVTRIFENNMLQFLQVNNLDGNYDLNRVGKRLLKQKIQLDNTGITDIGKWNRYTLDLSKFIQAEPGAIYQLSISFKKGYAAYVCEDGDSSEELTEVEDEILEDSNYGEGYYEEEYYYGEDYDWDQRDNPCNSSYYTNSRTIKKNILASDFGLLAKRGNDGSTTVIVNDLKTTEPMNGVTLEFYDFQQQLLGSMTTSQDGRALFVSKDVPFAVVAKNGSQRGYMRMMDGESLSLSGFDVSGDYINKGLKGFIYGERGVWRPGDSVYLSFILEDKNKILPAAHPVVFELQNPQGTVVNRQVKSSSENGFYRLATATDPDAPTGNWMARIKVGGAEFNQQVKIETIKPNRLKINLDFGGDKILSPDITGNLEVKWLHGAPGKNLKAEFEVTLGRANTSFPKYDAYVFEEPSGTYTSETQSIFQGSTDGEGKATFNATLPSSEGFPGFMTAVFRGKVFEESGNFSIDRISMPYFPYESYAGLKTPAGERYSGMLFTDTTQRLDVVFLDINGAPVSRTDATIGVYRLNRYWWWDNAQDNVANYIQGQNAQLVSSGKVNAPNGKANWSFKIGSADWGTYYIRVCDPVSGHCTGKTVYIDQPGYYGRYSREDKGGATQLSFTSDKAKYNVGDKINLTIPGSGQGRALISVENGSKVLSTYWIQTQKGDNQFSIDATAEMTPNIFVNVSLLQPHSQTVNDLPIRLYGVVPIGVEDPATHLEPVISMAEEIQPGQEVVIKVSEKTKRKMTFTLAMVDEGLLDITKFKTPDPWKKFYAREALGVKTWDLYDDVMGAFGSRIERLLAVGGDAELEANEEDPRANRFKPVVKYFGPVTLDAGETKDFKFTMPQYIGSVKTMVVAGYEGAYGQAEKVTPVRKPLMVLATLPRVLGPEENVKLPITLFTQDKSIKNVKIEVKVTGPVALVGDASRNVSMSASGDLTVDFELAVKAAIGVGKITVKASSGSFTASDEIEIDIRNPNPPVSQVADTFLEAGKSWTGNVIPVGLAGTNSAVLEVSSIPPINLGYRLRYLMEYPHGCVEQTTSAAFPQLYLSVVKELNESELARTKFNITKAIERLKMFITRDGGFAYWPGYDDSDSWGSTYAGHFLIEAEQKGYYVPADMLKRWKKYQRNKALEWRRNDNKYYNTDLIQAYRLYTLAAADAAELSAMNRLRELQDLSLQAKWMLAAAYAKAGQPEAAKKIISNLTTTVKPYQEQAYSYGSDVRDRAIILETLILLNDKTKAFELVKEISNSLSNSSYWMSTQTIAYSLKAVGMFVATEKRAGVKYEYSYGGKTISASTDLPLSQIPLVIAGAQKAPIKITNASKGSLFVRVISTGTPARGQETDSESNLALTITYTDTKGNAINPATLTQGTEFFANVTVKNPGVRGQYQNLALTQIFPSGWEINNLRLTDDENTVKADYGDYQDIRDDRVYTYFGLGPGASRTFKTILTAGYAGTYYLPGVSCEAMYDNSIYARKKGEVVQVTKSAPVP